MTEQIIENLKQEIGDKALTTAYFKAENQTLKQQVADLTAQNEELTRQLDELTAPKGD